MVVVFVSMKWKLAPSAKQPLSRRKEKRTEALAGFEHAATHVHQEPLASC